MTTTTAATSRRVQSRKSSTKRVCRARESSRTSCPRGGSELAAWTGPDLAWASACRPAWVAGLRRSASAGLLTGGEKGKRRGKEEREEGREREKKREVRERERRERGKRKFRVCSGFSEVETRLYSVRVFRKTRKVTDLPLFFKKNGYHILPSL